MILGPIGSLVILTSSMIDQMCVVPLSLFLETVVTIQKNLMNNAMMAIRLLVMDVAEPVSSNEKMELSVETVMPSLVNNVMTVISMMVTLVRVFVRIRLQILDQLLFSLSSSFSLSEAQGIICTERAKLLHKYLL